MNVEMLFQNFFHAEFISGQEILSTLFWLEFRQIMNQPINYIFCFLIVECNFPNLLKKKTVH